MRYTTTAEPLKNIKTDCLIIGVFERKQLTDAAKTIDTVSRGEISSILSHGDFQGKLGQLFTTYSVKRIQAKRVLLVGLGKKGALSARDFRKAVSHAYKRLAKSKSKTAVTTLHQHNIQGHDDIWNIRASVLQLSKALYTFDLFKSKKAEPVSLNKLTLAFDDKLQLNAANVAIDQADAIAQGASLTKDLGNMPPNVCNPAYLATQAQALAADDNRIHCKILEEKDMEKLGMGSFLSVSQGSDAPGKMAILEYKGGEKDEAPIVLVGKGVTFDTGGTCIKSAAGMADMKYDMCGAATVLGVIKASAAMNLPLNVTVIVAAAENMINGKASRVSDVVTSMSGQTIEIVNTDAEGRLVLCDAMTYAQTLKPEEIITVATLTGAVISSLGYYKTGLLSSHQPLADGLLNAGKIAEDRAWQLPLNEDYKDLLKSEYADMVNSVISREAGTVTSAAFLSHFTENTPWAHLDIAGTATIPGRQAKASGRPIPLLMEYLIQKACM